MPGKRITSILFLSGACVLSMLNCTEEAGQEYPYRTVRNSKRKDHLRKRFGSVSEISDMDRACSLFQGSLDFAQCSAVQEWRPEK